MLRRGIGLLVAAAALVCILMPLRIGELVGASPMASSDLINLRASYGGTLLGLGLILLAVPRLKPARAVLLHFILYLMVGIGLARALGFAIDGNPDTRQWIWLSAEIVIVIVCLLIIRHRSTRR